MRTAADNRRYYLHQQLKRMALSYDVEDGRINITPRRFDELSAKQRRYIGELVANHGYIIQLCLC